MPSLWLRRAGSTPASQESFASGGAIMTANEKVDR
jgi:hypothetical protein